MIARAFHGRRGVEQRGASATLVFEIRSRWFKRQWWWRLKAKNGEIIAVGSESYWNRGDCLAAIELVREGAGGAIIRFEGV